MQSIWKENIQRKEYPTLEKDEICQICIVGAGLNGVVLAYLLKDYDVILIDQDTFMNGSSSMNTGKLTAQHSDCYHKIIKKYGFHVARSYYEHNQKAIEQVIQWHKEFNFTLTQCDTYLYSKNEDSLQKEKEAYETLQIPHHYHHHKTYTTLSMEQQYQFHPIELANALLQNMPKVRCFEHTQILKYDTNITLYTPNHTITCQQVIFTTHSPSMFNEYFLFSRYKAYSSYILAKPYAYNKPFSALSIDQPSISLRTIDYNQDKYLLICNEDHRFGVHNTSPYKNLKHKTQSISQETLLQWQNHDYETFDLLPFIGEIKDNIYITFGYNLWGNSWSIASSLLLSQAIINHQKEQLYNYRPQRITDCITLPFVQNNIDTLYLWLKYVILFHYHKPNGSIILFNKKKYGYYEDDKQKILVDIHCPHLGCILQYNKYKETWDCPCHASSFNYDGKRIAGPTTKSLAHITIKKE